VVRVDEMTTNYLINHTDKVKALAGYPTATCHHEYCHVIVNINGRLLEDVVATQVETVGWTQHVRHCAIWATAIMNWTRPHRVVEAQGEDETTRTIVTSLLILMDDC
jgi:hypothetical protein